MKGIIIYEDYRGKEIVEAVKLGVVNYTTSSSDSDWVSELSGIRKGATQAYCNKEDDYDFEIGALIALMKMCGVDKVVRACNEAFSEDTFKTYALKYERELREFKKDSDKVIDKLIEENEKLKLDCEKLQHGYNDMVFCRGRQNGKQHTALVNMFKKLDQKKVDAAYKEAYNTTLPVWQKEVLNQMYGVYKESKKKTVDSLIEESISLTRKRFDEWLYGQRTKRAEMWNDILACGDCEHSKYIEVKKEDLEMFAKECNEKKIFDISGYEFHIKEFWFADDSCIFQIFRKPAGFICVKSVGFAHEDAIVDYLPPMRWDLFKKGRKIVRITPENLDDFMTKCSNNLGCIIKPAYKYDTHVFIMISDYHYDNKPTIHIMTPEDLVRNQHENSKKYSDKKIVDWEDVR